MLKTERMITVRGTGNKCGLAIGKTVYVGKQNTAASNTFTSIREELKKYREARNALKNELESTLCELLCELDEKEAWVVSMQSILIDEEVFSTLPENRIMEGVSASKALELSVDELLFGKRGYVEEIMPDIKEISDRLIEKIEGLKSADECPSETYILLSPSPTVSQIINNRKNICGIVAGSAWHGTSGEHIASALKIPTVATEKDDLTQFSGESAIIDAQIGTLYINPDIVQLEKYSKEIKKTDNEERLREELIASPCITKSGERFHLFSDFDDFSTSTLKEDAPIDGIYISSYLLSETNEETLFDTYRRTAEAFFGVPIIIKLYGGSSSLKINRLIQEGNDTLQTSEETELYVLQNNILEAQIRSALRASVYGRFFLAVNNVDSLYSIEKISSVVDEISEELHGAGREHSGIKLGVIVDKECLVAQINNSSHESNEIELLAQKQLLKTVFEEAKKSNSLPLLYLKNKASPRDLELALELGVRHIILKNKNLLDFKKIIVE